MGSSGERQCRWVEAQIEVRLQLSSGSEIDSQAISRQFDLKVFSGRELLKLLGHLHQAGPTSLRVVVSNQRTFDFGLADPVQDVLDATVPHPTLETAGLEPMP